MIWSLGRLQPAECLGKIRQEPGQSGRLGSTPISSYHRGTHLRLLHSPILRGGGDDLTSVSRDNTNRIWLGRNSERGTSESSFEAAVTAEADAPVSGTRTAGITVTARGTTRGLTEAVESSQAGTENTFRIKTRQEN